MKRHGRQQRAFIEECVETAIEMIRAGESDLTWNEIAEQRVAPKTASRGDRASVLGARAAIRDALQDHGYTVCPVNERYFERTDDPTDPRLVRRLIPVIGNPMEVGLRVCPDSTDLYWVTWQEEQGKKGNGLVRSMGEQVIAAAERDGQVATATEMIGAALAEPQMALDGSIRRVLGTTPEQIARAGRKAHPLVQ